MTKTQKTWHILGAGAIGCLWAIRLQKAGVQVRLILSERKMRSLRGSCTLELQFQSGPQQAIRENIRLKVAQADEHPQHILLATKANDAIDALSNWEARLSGCRNIVTLCNGMGYHAAIQELLPAAAVFAISTTDGAYFQQENSLVLAGKGTNKIARLKNDGAEHKLATEQLARQLSTRGHRLLARQNAKRMLMDKLLINACINGLTAIHNCCNGELLTVASIRIELEQLIEECQRLAVACGFTTLGHQLKQRVHTVAKATENNYSSTCMDIKLGRRTEIDYINAYLCAMADQLEQAAPINRKIVSAIHRLEKAAPLP